MKNVGASVRAKLLNLSRTKNVPLDALMERYAIGRFLYRLAQSRYRKRGVFNGCPEFFRKESPDSLDDHSSDT